MNFEEPLKLGKNTFYGKFWRWFYVMDEDDLPQSLCPYFWQMVVALIFAIPVFILRIPEAIFWKINEMIYKYKIEKAEAANQNLYIPDRPYFRTSYLDGFVYRTVNGLVMWFIILLIGYLVAGWITLILTADFNNENVIVSLIFTGGIVLVVVIVYLINNAFDLSEIKTPTFVKIIKEYKKGIKEKYCPPIDWY